MILYLLGAYAFFGAAWATHFDSRRPPKTRKKVRLLMFAINVLLWPLFAFIFWPGAD